MNFKKWVKSIQTAGYNGARTVHTLGLPAFHTWPANHNANIDNAEHQIEKGIRLIICPMTTTLFGSIF